VCVDFQEARKMSLIYYANSSRPTFP
jgi:hypothetical protein